MISGQAIALVTQTSWFSCSLFHNGRYCSRLEAAFTERDYYDCVYGLRVGAFIAITQHFYCLVASVRSQGIHVVGYLTSGCACVSRNI